jgi:hypothetical protein
MTGPLLGAVNRFSRTPEPALKERAVNP